MSTSRKDQKEHIFNARTYYGILDAGNLEDAEKLVPYIRQQLSLAGVDAGVLDPTGERTADELEQQMNAFITKARRGHSRSRDSDPPSPTSRSR